MRRGGKRRAALPAAVALVLCVVAFLGGRWWRSTKRQAVTAHAPSPVLRGRRTALLAAQQPQYLQLADLQLLDPLQTEDLERHLLHGSGLLDVRPPLIPGGTGDHQYHAIPFQILSWWPRIIVFPAFIDPARCQHIIGLAQDKLAPSGLAYRPGEKAEEEQNTRTSKGTFLLPSEDPQGVLTWLENRIAAVTGLPRDHGEAFNVLQYRNLQHYSAHMDSFDPKDFGPQPSQRVATVLVYLSEVTAGGETIFKREGVDGVSKPIYDWDACDQGEFKYAPRMGDAVLFWSVDPDGTINPRSLHGGCPVLQGEKWVTTKWLRSKPTY